MQVGSEIESICGKCGDTWHVVIALVDRRIARVECRECGARHRHRPPGGRASAPAAKRRGEPRTRASALRRSAERVVVEADPSRPRRPFRTSDVYQVGDRIVHATFGEGVVQAVTGPQKVEVLFGAGPKTLVHARKTG